MEKNIYLFSLLFFSGTLLGQSGTVSTGSSVSTPNGSLSVSVGQVAYVSASDSNGSINPGNQQTYEISVSSKSELSGVTLSFAVYPNPTSDVLTMRIESKQFEKLSYRLTDAAGKMISQNAVSGEITEIDFKPLASGAYLLSVYQSEKPVNSYKILKK